MTAKVQLPGYCMKHDSHNCGCVCERRERPRLASTTLIFYDFVPHFFRGHCPPKDSALWIEYVTEKGGAS